MANRAKRGELKTIGRDGVAKLKSAYISDPTMTFDRLSRLSESIAGRSIPTSTIKDMSKSDPDGTWDTIRSMSSNVLVCDQCGHAIDISAGERSFDEEMEKLAIALSKDIISTYEDEGQINLQKVKVWMEIVDRVESSSRTSTNRGHGAWTIDDLLREIESK